MSVGPSGVVGVTYRGFNLLHRSLLKRFPVLIWLLFGRSLVSHFRPDTGGRRWSLVQVASSLALWGGRAAASHLRCSGSRPLCVERALRCARFQPSAFHGSADSVAPAFCAFPGPAAQAARSLTCLPIFNWTFVFCCWVLSSLSIFGYRLLTRCMISKYCLRLSLLPFHFVDGSFCCAEAF